MCIFILQCLDGTWPSSSPNVRELRERRSMKEHQGDARKCNTRRGVVEHTWWKSKALSKCLWHTMFSMVYGGKKPHKSDSSLRVMANIRQRVTKSKPSLFFSSYEVRVRKCISCLHFKKKYGQTTPSFDPIPWRVRSRRRVRCVKVERCRRLRFRYD